MGRREGGEAGRWMAQIVFIRTFFVRGKIGGEGSVFGKVRVGESSRGKIGVGATMLLGARRSLDGLEQDAPATVFPVIARDRQIIKKFSTSAPRVQLPPAARRSAPPSIPLRACHLCCSPSGPCDERGVM